MKEKLLEVKRFLLRFSQKFSESWHISRDPLSVIIIFWSVMPYSKLKRNKGQKLFTDNIEDE